MSTPLDYAMSKVKWTRYMTPADVEPGQHWTNKRTGVEVRVMEVDSRYAVVLRYFPPPARSWRIERHGLVSRYTVVQDTLSDRLRIPPPPPARARRGADGAAGG